MQYYALFCRTGKEKDISDRLASLGLSAIIPRKVVNQRTAAGLERATRNLLPGYVFIEAEEEPDWNEVRTIPNIIRLLEYGNGHRALHGTDLDFIRRIKGFGNVLDVSQVIRVGTRIEFVSGPLREMGGRVIRVNRKRNVVEVRFGEDGSLFSTIWCPIEYVEEHSC